jgi:ATP-dependent RNA helicase RhlE
MAVLEESRKILMATTFSDLPIIEPILSTLRSEGYEVPTPIQAAAIPLLIDGKDLLGCAQTGTGKTAAFAIPILQHLHGKYRKPISGSPRALILVPTRELAVQVHESFETYGRSLRMKYAAIFGGVGQGKQVAALERGIHVLIATPGRLMDLMGQGYIKLDLVDHLVLDEADRMLDMGFLPSIKKIVKEVPTERQSIFLSATMPPPIQELAQELLRDPETIMIAPPFTTAQRVRQRVMYVAKENKRALLEKLLQDERMTKVLVFTRTKHGADRLTKNLRTAKLTIDAIHGNKSQNARQRVLNEFRTGKLRVLVATDVAARGLDVDGITHVVNFEISNEPDSYVHRIGRTARAGESGESISFCDIEELEFLRDVEKEIGKKVPLDRDQPFHVDWRREDIPRAPKGRGGKKSSPSNRRPSRPPRDGGFSKHSRPEKTKRPEGESAAEPQRKRSLSGKIRKVKPKAAKKKSYGFSYVNNSGQGGGSSSSRPKKKGFRRSK